MIRSYLKKLKEVLRDENWAWYIDAKGWRDLFTNPQKFSIELKDALKKYKTRGIQAGCFYLASILFLTQGMYILSLIAAYVGFHPLFYARYCYLKRIKNEEKK